MTNSIGSHRGRALHARVATSLANVATRVATHVATLVAILASPAVHAIDAQGGPQGTGGSSATAQVTGRVAMIERTSEATTDLGNTVIYLVPVDTASAALAPLSSTIAMNGRAFVPRLRVVTPGSRVAFPNQDPFSHNIFSTTPGAAFDLGLYPSGKSKDARFRKPGAYPVYCNIHPRMTAYVVVAPTRWFTQAGNDGRWTIDNVPVGRYTLHVWHERAKEVESEVTVTAAGIGGLATQLDARGFRFAQHKNKFGKEYDKSGKDRY